LDKNANREAIFGPKAGTSVGTWNARTLKTEESLPILERELSRYNCDIVGVSETHRLGTEEFFIGDHKFVGQGRTDGVHRSGVGFLLSRRAQAALIEFKPVSDRLVGVTLHTAVGTATIFQVYAPTSAASDVEIDLFYANLQTQLSKTRPNDVVMVIGDFNAKVGSDMSTNRSAVGPFGLGNANERGEQLVHFCNMNNMIITNTCFQQQKANRLWTWESPDGVTHNQIDFIIVNRKWRSSVMNCRSFPGADVGSDHQLVIANFRLKLKKRESPENRGKFDVKKLKDPAIATTYREQFAVSAVGLQSCEGGADEMWGKVKAAFNSTAGSVLGRARRGRQKDWISGDTYKLVDERRVLKAHKQENAATAKYYNFLCREIRRRCKKDREEYINGICQEVEQAHLQKKSKKVFEGIKKIQQKRSQQSNVIKDKQGSILTDPAEVKARWEEHFSELYNQVNSTDDTVLLEIPEDNGSCGDADSPAITKDEVRWAISCLKRDKAPGVDMVTAEEIIAAGEDGVDVMFVLCSKIWTEERIPEEWKQSIIVPIFKKKDKLVCDNYRGISLLCHAEKLVATIILHRIRPRTEEILSEAQAGFRSGRSTIDQLLSLRLIAEKYQGYDKDMYICYVDFQKAFDSVWRRGLWQTMRHLGYDRKVIRLLESLYRSTKSAVRVGTKGEVSNWFETLVGVLQGCVLSPLLFNIMLEVVMALADVDEAGILVSGARISNLRFADDIAFLADGQPELQQQISQLHTTSSRFGLKISTSKTEVQCISRQPPRLQINIDGTELNQVEQFTYLGGVISQDARCEADIRRRVNLATGVASSLNTVWESRDISVKTKVRVYEALVMSVLLYNSETWTMKGTDESRLRVFEMSVLRRICGVSLRDRWRNEEIKARLEIECDVVEAIRRRRLSYFGHINRMKPERIPARVLHGWIHGNRPRGRPQKKWTDAVKEDCEDRDVTYIQACRIAEDREEWRKLVFRPPKRSTESQRP